MDNLNIVMGIYQNIRRNRMKKKCWKILGGAFLFLFLSLNFLSLGQEKAPEINLPASLQSADVVGYIRVKNLSNIVDIVDYWISQLNPQMPPGTTRMSVGQYLGDPTLASVDHTRPILIAILDPKKFVNPMLLFLPVTQPEKIQQGIQARNSFAVLKEKTLIIGDDQPSVLKGAEIWTQIQPFAAAPLETDILFDMDMQKLMTVYGADMRLKIKNFQNQLNMMQSMGAAPQANMEAQQKQLDAQVEEIFKTLNEMKNLALKIDLKKEGLLPTLMMEAKEQTDLFRLFTSKVVSQPSLARMLPEGAVKISFSSDPERMVDFSSKFTNRILTKSGALTPEQLKELEKFQALQKEIVGDEMAMSLFLPSQAGLNGVVIQKIRDPKKCLEMIRQTRQQILLSAGATQGVTMNAELTEKARTVEGVDVHLLKITINTTDPRAQQQMMMFLPGGGMNLEMAIVGNLMITAIGIPIDQSIQTVKQGAGMTAISAMSSFPKGAQLYGDIDFPKMLKSLLSPMFAMMSQMMGSGQNPFDAFNKITAPPIVFFATMNNGKALAQLDFKFEIVKKIADAFKTMQQQMQPPQQQQPQTQQPQQPITNP